MSTSMAGAKVDVSSTASSVESLVRVCVAGLFFKDPPFAYVCLCAVLTALAFHFRVQRRALTTAHVKQQAAAAAAALAEGKTEDKPEASTRTVSAMTLPQLQAEKVSRGVSLLPGRWALRRLHRLHRLHRAP